MAIFEGDPLGIHKLRTYDCDHMIEILTLELEIPIARGSQFFLLQHWDTLTMMCIGMHKSHMEY